MVESQTDQIVGRLKEVSRNSKQKIPAGCLRRLKTILLDLETCKMPLPCMVQVPKRDLIVCVWQDNARELILEVCSKGPMTFKSVIHILDKEGSHLGVKTGEGLAPKTKNVDSLMAWLLIEKAAEA